MNTFSQLIDLWPTKAEFASDLGVEYGVAHQWDRRDSIPSDYWNDVIAAAERRQLKGINLELLAEISSKKKLQ